MTPFMTPFMTLLGTLFMTGMAAAFSLVAIPTRAAAQQPSTTKVVVIVLDDSGSMNKPMSGGQSRLQAAKQALLKVIETLPSETRLGIMLLNGKGAKNRWLVPLGTLDVAEASRQVQQTVADGGTPLGAGMSRATDELLKLRENSPYGDFRLLVVTDGEATDAEVLNKNLPSIVARGIVLDVIGVDMKGNHSLASRSHSYRRADDAGSFEKAVKEVFAESSVDANADDQTGFDLIAALPDELATQALKTMHEVGQTAVGGTSSAQQSGSSPSAAHSANSQASNNVAQPSSSASATGSTPENHSTASTSHSTGPSNQQTPRENGSGIPKIFIAIIIAFIFMILRGLKKKNRARLR